MTEDHPERLRRGVWLAPGVFVLHFLEESPTFVAWFNAHVTNGITQDLFWTVNLVALAITIVLAFVVWTAQSTVSLALVIAWLSFLMLANAIVHIVGAVVDGAYVPGLATAVALYVPYCVWIGVHVVRSRLMSAGPVVLAALLGGLPMAIHGYRILFLGSRLF